MLCQAAVTLDQLTDLGQNVTINCDLDINEVYWILLKQSDSHTVILQSFSNPTSAFYFNKTFKNKYSVKSKHRLVIYNITADELGVYYCMNTDTPPKLSNSTRLNIIEPTQPSEFSTTITQHPTIHQSNNQITITEQNSTQYTTVILISGLMIVFLFITGLVTAVCAVNNSCWIRSGNSSGQLYKTDFIKQLTQEQHQDPNQLQYVTVVYQAV
nr:uncharacterized protein LOC129452776 [Misgurnus anguillicaudatus]